MWSSTVGLVNGRHRYLTAETFGFKVNSNGQQLKRRQQWTIEPFPENTGPDGSISSAASVSSSQCPLNINGAATGPNTAAQMLDDPTGASTCIMTLTNGTHVAGFMRHSNASNNGSDHSQSCDEEHENVAIKSHLNKYLAVDSFGNVTCDSDEKSENARFTITICSMSQGKSKDEHIFWAFKNVERGYYLGATEDGMICCNAKMPKSRAELWHLHLLPARGASFFALKSLGRKRFARVVNDQVINLDAQPLERPQTCDKTQVQLDANISWGPETLFQFKYFEGGRYAILTSDNMYLTNEGKCAQIAPSTSAPTDQATLPPNECLFTLEYHSGYLAFRDSFGHYLAAAGRSSVLRSRSLGVSRDELFLFEGVPVQVSLKATFNNRWVSIKQGVDVTANQMETSSKYETFQLTYHKQTQLWSIMTQECNFWTISKNTNTVCVCKPADYEAHTRGQFKLVWSENDATFSLKFVDHLNNLAERWILARKSGQLYVTGAGPSGQESVKFVMRFQNRRLLNLRPTEGSGFVGIKSQSGAGLAASKQLEANKTSADTIQIEYSELQPVCNAGTQLNERVANEAEQVADNERVIEASNNSKVISMFKVKLNSTKMGQNFFANTNNITQGDDSIRQANGVASFMQPQQQQQVAEEHQDDKNDCFTIDSNNNEPELNGGVESAANPSVASIINTFSNIMSIEQQQQQQQQQTQPSTRPSGSTVSKLASSFETNNISTSSDCVSVDGNNESNISSNHESSSMNCKLADQVAQSECCYMKVNGKYLVVGSSHLGTNGETASGAPETNQSFGVLCDATNKACAQSWIIELRSHNSIAIRASDTQAYMQLGTNGTIYLSRCESKDASLWEF